MDANMILNGKFTFKKLPNGSIDKTKVICVFCRCEQSEHIQSETPLDDGQAQTHTHS